MLKNLLILAVLALGAACVFLVIQAAARGATIDELRRELNDAANVNAAETAKVVELAREKNDLVSKIAADVARAEAAVERITALEYENEALEISNAKLRDGLAASDPDAASWLAAGMPAAVACSMWPAEPACAH